MSSSGTGCRHVASDFLHQYRYCKQRRHYPQSGLVLKSACLILLAAALPICGAQTGNLTRSVCLAGTHMVDPETAQNCSTCPHESFTSESNRDLQCTPCTRCRHPEKEKSRCTTTSNTVCECPPGTSPASGGGCKVDARSQTSQGVTAKPAANSNGPDWSSSPPSASSSEKDVVTSTLPIEQSKLKESTTETVSTAAVTLPPLWIATITGLVAAILGVLGALLLLSLIILVVFCCPDQHKKRMSTLAGKLRTFQQTCCGNAVGNRCGAGTADNCQQADSPEIIQHQQQKQVPMQKKDAKQRSSYYSAVDMNPDKEGEQDCLLTGQHNHSSNTTSNTLPSANSTGSASMTTV